ncbi:MAG: ribonuclease R [Burkholderiaceae bacterium]
MSKSRRNRPTQPADGKSPARSSARGNEDAEAGGPQFSGRLIGHRDGFGFIAPDTGGDDVFVSPREMLKAMHGDRVTARIIGSDRRGRPEAMIVEVLEHTIDKLVGRLVHERGIVLVVPEDQRIKHDIIVSNGDTMGAKPGQVVMVEIIDPPTRYTPPVGRVVEVLGSIEDPGIEVEIAVRKFDVPHQFSEEALKCASKLPDQVRTADVKDRIDLRDVDLMTIDGEDARDFDDAVYAEPFGPGGKKGWRLLVAIADVSHYVQDGDGLDRDAFARATSVYFPRQVLPMLPEKLSNGLCSLNPNVERLAMVCDMVVGPDGLVKAYQFYEAVIESSARLTYEQAWTALSDPTGPEARVLGPRFQVLSHLEAVFRALLAAREQRGAFEIETVETIMRTDAQGRIDKILPRMRNDAHRLIEECMLAANTSAADLIIRSKRQGLFRVHEGPTPEKLSALREFLKLQGLRLAGGEDPSPADYARLSREMKQRPDYKLLQTLLLRSMQQAIYSPDNMGHFGLAYPAYTHFTSPIRRYPDLLVHRVIKNILAEKTYTPIYGELQADPSGRRKKAANTHESLSRWRVIGEHCSAAERRADDASRDVEAWLKCQFMKDKVGEQMAGTVTGVAPFGLFVTLDALYVEGLIHVSELGAEYFQHNDIVHELRGERTGRRFRLYDPVNVQVSRVDLDARRIEFRLIPAMMRAVKKTGLPTREEFDEQYALQGGVDADDDFLNTRALERGAGGPGGARGRGRATGKSGQAGKAAKGAKASKSGRTPRAAAPAAKAASAKAPKAARGRRGRKGR